MQTLSSVSLLKMAAAAKCPATIFSCASPPSSSFFTKHPENVFLTGQPLFASLHVTSGKDAGQKRNYVVSKRLSGLEEAMRIRRSRELRDLQEKTKRAPLRPGKVSGRLVVPEHILRPPYAASEILPEIAKEHQIHDDEGTARMKAAGELAARVLEFAGSLVRDGDIINIDVTVYLNGYHGDTSRTFLCGNVDQHAKRLVKVTEECLEKAISVCKDGVRFKKIGDKICDHAERLGFNVVERFVGHGVGRIFHSEPIIFHNRNNEPGYMVEGETFTIEPIVSMGSIECKTWDDGWTALTKDGSLAAQFEHTLLITKTGAEILTKC